uniref:VHS domain-containing protein n=1 Tax=Physcomitrium patens TaxID=3218 RepID=A0A2K1L8Q9_PHYPA|nr:hypothetical protein PHYPA_000805 [Physcomitrium patens]
MGLRLHDSPHRGINLRSSLTDRESTYSHSDSQASTYSLSSHETFESRSSKTEGTEGGRPCHNGKPMSQEDRLVDAVTTPGGVRLQPSREEVQNFLTAATKLDGDLLGYALLSKLQARLWQVRLKAMCIVEAVLRQGDSHDVYQRMGGIFQENYGCIDENAESPQASLKEKSKKVLGLLGRGNSAESRHQTGPGHISPASYSSSAGSSAQQSVVLPDLLDGWDASEGADVVQNTGTLPQQQITSADAPTESSSKAAGDDLLRVFNWNENALQSTQTTREGDHLAELSVNTASTISFDNDLFSGLRVDAVHGDASSGAFGDTGLFEGLGVKDSITAKTAQPPAENLVDLFDGLSTETSVTVNYASIDSFQGLSSSLDSKPSAIGTNISQLQSLSGGNTSRPSVGNGQIASSQFVTSSVRGPLPSQMMYTYPALLAPTAGGTFQPSMASLEFAHGPAIIAGMSALMMQQQLAANLETMQALGIGMGPPVGTGSQGNGVSTCSFGQIYNDGFDFSNPAGPAHSTEPQKEETKAFDWLKLS